MISIHTNKAGITFTVPATRNSHSLQICLSFWQWTKYFKGPCLMLLTPNNADCFSGGGYYRVVW